MHFGSFGFIQFSLSLSVFRFISVSFLAWQNYFIMDNKNMAEKYKLQASGERATTLSLRFEA